MIPYAPEPTQTTESFRRHLPNTASDRLLLVEQLVFVSLWSSFNSLLKNVHTETSPLVSRHNSRPGTPVRVAERWGQLSGERKASVKLDRDQWDKPGGFFQHAVNSPSLPLLLRDKIALTVSSGSGTSPPLGG